MTKEEKKYYEQNVRFNVLELVLKNKNHHNTAEQIIETADKYWDWINNDTNKS